MSKVIFKASKYLSVDEINVVLYLSDYYTRSWVDYCDGKEVEMENELIGCILDSREYVYLIHIDWCEVVEL